MSVAPSKNRGASRSMTVREVSQSSRRPTTAYCSSTTRFASCRAAWLPSCLRGQRSRATGHRHRIRISPHIVTHMLGIMTICIRHRVNNKRSQGHGNGPRAPETGAEATGHRPMTAEHQGLESGATNQVSVSWLKTELIECVTMHVHATCI